MKTLFSKWLALCTGAALTASLAAPVMAQTAAQPIVIKFSHVVAKDTPKGKGAERFKELAEKSTGGRVRVEVYHNSILYKDKEEMDALQLGAVQMLAPTFSKFGPLGLKEFEVFDLPYLFPNKDMLHGVTEGPVGKMLFKKLETKGITGLAFWDAGFKVMTANKPLHGPEDMKGLKMRIQSSKVLDAQMRALGANPQVTTMSEVYQALQTGVVDGQENTPSNIYTQKMHEVQKHLSMTNHGYIGWVVIVNKKFWDELPADIRANLQTSLRDATRYMNALSEQDNVAALEGIARSGKTTIYTPTAAENAAWRKALLPVQKEMESRIGKETIDMVRSDATRMGYK